MNLISFQKKGGWINTNMHTPTHLLIHSFITWMFVPEQLWLSMSWNTVQFPSQAGAADYKRTVAWELCCQNTFLCHAPVARFLCNNPSLGWWEIPRWISLFWKNSLEGMLNNEICTDSPVEAICRWICSSANYSHADLASSNGAAAENEESWKTWL